MFDTLRNYVGLGPLFTLLGIVLVVVTIGLWYVKKTTGRPIRDMLAVLGAGVVFVLLMMPAVILFHDRLNSPNGRARHLAEDVFAAVYIPIAILVTWAFNKLVKQRSSRKRDEQANDATGKVG